MFDLSPYCTHPGLTVQFREEVTSTNTLLRQQAEEGAPEGTVLVAARQTAGRGRRDRSFFSPADTGLYLSILLRPKLAPQEALYLTTCAAAAVALALEEFDLRPQIKWVNDLFLEGKKVCGILTEGAIDPETMGLRYAILGIGVNLFPRKGASRRTCPRPARSSSEDPTPHNSAKSWPVVSWTTSSGGILTFKIGPSSTPTGTAPWSWVSPSPSSRVEPAVPPPPWTWNPTSPCGSGSSTAGRPSSPPVK